MKGEFPDQLEDWGLIYLDLGSRFPVPGARFPGTGNPSVYILELASLDAKKPAVNIKGRRIIKSIDGVEYKADEER